MIGYYVHHQGAGHLRRLETLRPHLATEVTVLSSLPAPRAWRGPWVTLASDDTAHPMVDADARGTLHWVPQHHPGLRTRARQIVDWLDEAKPDLLITDVSVEVGMLARLAGVPVVSIVMPGDRRDRPHTLLHDLAAVLLAPWPNDLQSQWPGHLHAKTTYTGAFSRFDNRPRRDPPGDRDPRLAVLLWGYGGDGLDTERIGELRRATPEWCWELATPAHPRSSEELWQLLDCAGVVVTHAGENAVAEVAAAGAPAVVVADARPFDEQLHISRYLDRTGIAIGVDQWPATPEAWPGLLSRACALGGRSWCRWSPGDGAERMAAAIDIAALRLRATGWSAGSNATARVADAIDRARALSDSRP